MEVKGKYIREHIQFRDCLVYIERGKIYNVSLPDAAPIVRSSYVPMDKSNFTLERLPSKKTGLIPYDSNYLIQYLGNSGKQNRIYLKLNHFQSIRLKWVLRQYIIQSKEMKTDILKYFIGGVIGLFFGFVGDNLLKSNQEETDTDLDEKVELNSQPDTEASNVVSDSIEVDSLSNID